MNHGNGERERWVKGGLLVTGAIATLLVALVEFQFIDKPSHKWLIYGLLVLSIWGNLFYSLWTSRKQRFRDASSVITKLLNLSSQTFQQITGCNFRVCVFVPDKRNNSLRMLFYSGKFRDYPKERVLTWDKREGVVGNVWFSKKFLWGDLTLPEVRGGSTWGLSSEKVELTKNVKAVLALPILVNQNSSFFGVLSFDTLEDLPLDFSYDRLIDAANLAKEQIEEMITEYVTNGTFQGFKLENI